MQIFLRKKMQIIRIADNGDKNTARMKNNRGELTPRAEPSNHTSFL